jgi:uncharacterized membrane protein YcaP (DUF421 family)
MSPNFIFDGWEPVYRILLVGSTGFFAMVFLAQISSRRTLAKMNQYDFIMTVAWGASFGRVLTAREVSIVEALTAFSLLVALQFILSFFQKHSSSFSKIITADPLLLFYQGEFMNERMARENITKENLEAAIRLKGFSSFDEVGCIVMENNGRFSVIGIRQLSGKHEAVDSLRQQH